MAETGPSVEFRIPISPTEGFFAQVEFFNFGLRQLGPRYREARLQVVVGDNADMDAVRRANPWSEGFNVEWTGVPAAIFDEFGIHGTADWRLCSGPAQADVVCLVDADTVLFRDLDPLLADLAGRGAAVRGHMAHFPPPSAGVTLRLPPSDSAEYWAYLFGRFAAPWPQQLHPYSIMGGSPKVPAYFNLGFVALTPAALETLGNEIFGFQRAFARDIDSHMRCQIAVPLLAYKHGLDVDVLPAEYNAANDAAHLAANRVGVGDIRLLHYLREVELSRQTFLTEAHIDAFLGREPELEVNRALRDHVARFAAQRREKVR
jgi:hypothetical protein